MTKLSFISPVFEGIQAVERQMSAQADEYSPELHAALDLLLSAGGKRIRPALTLLTGQMLHGAPGRLVTLATAIELLHTATLVHDDLIDHSLLRRGVPTLNAKWSPGATVLTGDFIFAKAAQMAAETESIEVMKIFSQTLATIVNGEITQMFAGHCTIDRDQYYQRIYAKTASLFETATSTAAILSNAPEKTVETMRHFGYDVGIAFQIVDDILDFTGEQATLGKPVGSDLRQGILTLPAILYLEAHPSDPDGQTVKDHHCRQSDEQVIRLVESIRNSDAIHSAFQEALEFIERGIECLGELPDGAERRSLEELARYIVQRQL